MRAGRRRRRSTTACSLCLHLQHPKLRATGTTPTATWALRTTLAPAGTTASSTTPACGTSSGTASGAATALLGGALLPHDTTESRAERALSAPRLLLRDATTLREALLSGDTAELLASCGTATTASRPLRSLLLYRLAVGTTPLCPPLWGALLLLLPLWGGLAACAEGDLDVARGDLARGVPAGAHRT
jgi:hypothetical protein